MTKLFAELPKICRNSKERGWPMYETEMEHWFAVFLFTNKVKIYHCFGIPDGDFVSFK
jgi:hypothetical protein